MNKVLKALTITVLVLIIIAALAAVPNMIGKEIQTGTAVGYEWSANSPYEEQKTARGGRQRGRGKDSARVRVLRGG